MSLKFFLPLLAVCVGFSGFGQQNSTISYSTSSSAFAPAFYMFSVSPASLKVQATFFSTLYSDQLPARDTLDRDGDGIVDSLDKCPDEKGVKEYDGCPPPDSDYDGITDDKDACPTIAGSLKYNGCPVPDKDGDKINDDDDVCPDLPGVARFAGCLTADSDKDGVDDDNDDCKLVPGTQANRGCPELNVTVDAVKKAPLKKPVKPKGKK